MKKSSPIMSCHWFRALLLQIYPKNVATGPHCRAQRNTIAIKLLGISIRADSMENI